MSEVELNELVFTGPVTQEELILTWRKRRLERLMAELEAKKLEEEKNLNDSTEEPDEVTSSTESDRVSEPDSVIPSADQPEHLAEPEKPPTKSILRPAKLNVDSTSLNTNWAKRINMKKLDKPKRPAYVQPLEWREH